MSTSSSTPKTTKARRTKTAQITRSYTSDEVLEWLIKNAEKTESKYDSLPAFRYLKTEILFHRKADCIGIRRKERILWLGFKNTHGNLNTAIRFAIGALENGAITITTVEEGDHENSG